MKLTKSRLKEIIREEIQRLNEKKYSNLEKMIDNIHDILFDAGSADNNKSVQKFLDNLNTADVSINPGKGYEYLYSEKEADKYFRKAKSDLPKVVKLISKKYPQHAKNLISAFNKIK